MIALSSETKNRIRWFFSEPDLRAVEEYLLIECADNLPLVKTDDVELVERIRIAVIKLSGGKLTELKRAVEMAKRDWRDALMAAGFGESLDAHLSWKPIHE